MNDFHETENAMAESGKTTNAGDLDLPYARSADQPANRVDRDETQAFGSSVPEGGAGRPGINEPFSM
jgi:hypothetical protein